jgi:hypothetical protein
LTCEFADVFEGDFEKIFLSRLEHGSGESDFSAARSSQKVTNGFGRNDGFGSDGGSKATADSSAALRNDKKGDGKGNSLLRLRIDIPA